jgi:hypothetical protein
LIPDFGFPLSIAKADPEAPQEHSGGRRRADGSVAVAKKIWVVSGVFSMWIVKSRTAGSGSLNCFLKLLLQDDDAVGYLCNPA